MNIQHLTQLHHKVVFPHDIIFTPKTKLWCQLPYPNHPHGCPNYNKSPLCPPNSPEFTMDSLYGYKKLILLWVEFNFNQYKQEMGKKHPSFSQKQVECCLYYQNTLKNMLKLEITKYSPSLILGCGSGFGSCYSMESVGINVMMTLKKLQIPFEVKPKTKILLCTLLGLQKELKLTTLNEFYCSNNVNLLIT